METANIRGKWGNQAGFLIRMMVPATLWLCCLVSPVAYGNPMEETYFQPGVRNSRSRPLAGDQLRTLAAGIRTWTGFAEAHFDDQGRLQLGSTIRFAGGSETARALIVAAIEGTDAVWLEDHNGSSTVAFASIQPVEDHVDAGEIRRTAWALKLDFHDFRQLRGGLEGIAAFDPAICFFHELGHGVLHLRDSVLPSDPLGTCERHINKIRREAGRAERQSYLPQYRLGGTLECPAQSELAEFVFVKRGADDRAKTTLLFFRIESVCAPVTFLQVTGNHPLPLGTAAKSRREVTSEVK